MPQVGEVTFQDLIRGDISYDYAELDDVILQRSDGSPTYNFTVVVDDGDMGITHVLRGDDHINNTPKQIEIMKALGYTPPKYGHMSTILGVDGKRLSKRHGAANVLAYKAQGILPEALLNFLCRLGWSHGDQEVFSVDEMQHLFDLKSLQKSPAAFDPEKLLWLNQQHIMAAEAKSLVPQLQQHLVKCGVGQDQWGQFDLVAVVKLLQKRCKTMVEMAEQSVWLYQPELEYSKDKVKPLKESAKPNLQEVRAALVAIVNWDQAHIHEAISQVVADLEVGFGKVGGPLRAAITGGACSADLSEIIALLGQDRVIESIDRALAWIDHQAS